MTQAELACKAPTSAEYRCSTSFDFLAAREYSNDRIKKGLKNKEWGKQELMAICSTRGLKTRNCNVGTLQTRLCEYTDPKVKKGKFHIQPKCKPDANCILTNIYYTNIT